MISAERGPGIGNFEPVKSGRPEIKDEARIKEKVKKAEGRLVLFLKRLKKDRADYEITSENMLTVLDLLDIPRERALAETKKLIKASTILEITSKGLIKISKPELLLEKSTEPKWAMILGAIKEVVRENPAREFNVPQIARKLKMEVSIVRTAVDRIIQAGHAVSVREEDGAQYDSSRKIIVYRAAASLDNFVFSKRGGRREPKEEPTQPEGTDSKKDTILANLYPNLSEVEARWLDRFLKVYGLHHTFSNTDELRASIKPVGGTQIFLNKLVALGYLKRNNYHAGDGGINIQYETIKNPRKDSKK